jgi:hypothetical protein
MNGEKYLGNTKLKEVHDLVREREQCKIDEVVYNENELPFSTLDKAHLQGYSNCPYCIDSINKSLDVLKEKNTLKN